MPKNPTPKQATDALRTFVRDGFTHQAGAIDGLQRQVDDNHTTLTTVCDLLTKRLNTLERCFDGPDARVIQLNKEHDALMRRLDGVEGQLVSLEEDPDFISLAERVDKLRVDLAEAKFNGARSHRKHSQRLDALEASKSILALAWSKVCDWYNRIATCGADGGSYWSDQAAKLEADYNVTHPMEKAKATNPVADALSALSNGTCADLQDARIVNPATFDAIKSRVSQTIPNVSAPVAVSFNGEPLANPDPIQPSVIFYEAGEGKPAVQVHEVNEQALREKRAAAAEVNRLAREIVTGAWRLFGTYWPQPSRQLFVDYFAAVAREKEGK